MTTQKRQEYLARQCRESLGRLLKNSPYEFVPLTACDEDIAFCKDYIQRIGQALIDGQYWIPKPIHAGNITRSDQAAACNDTEATHEP